MSRCSSHAPLAESHGIGTVLSQTCDASRGIVAVEGGGTGSPPWVGVWGGGGLTSATWRHVPRRHVGERRSSQSPARRTIEGVLRRLRIENLVLIREAELSLDEGLNAITGETGAGKTILSNAIGLLLGARGDAAAIGAAGGEAYVEAEFDLPDAEALGALAELRPEGEEALVVARRIFADGRTRAYAWGRSAAREDVAAAVESLLAMSGQFEQRRLARPSYQLAVLDSFAGVADDAREARRAWRELLSARRMHDELTRDSASAQARLDELHALVADTEGLAPGLEDQLRAERERLRHVTELAAAAAGAVAALTPEDDAGAADLAGTAERAIAPYERLAPELAAAGEALRTAELLLRETSSELRSFLASLEAEPDRVEAVEAELERIADAKRRYRAQSYEELLARAAEARHELAALDDGYDPAQAAAETLARAQAEVERRQGELRTRRCGVRAGVCRGGG